MLSNMIENITVAKVVAYILVAFAIVMLLRLVFVNMKESFDVGTEVKKMCQPNLATPCHYREVRGENVSTGDQACHYAWSAPALFENKMTVNSRDQLQFCDSVNTRVDGDLKTEGCSETLDSIWSSFKEATNQSNDNLSKQVEKNSENVEKSKETLRNTTDAMERARKQLKVSATVASNSSDTIARIENELKEQKQCEKKLIEKTKSLKQKEKELSHANVIIQKCNSEKKNTLHWLSDCEQCNRGVNWCTSYIDKISNVKEYKVGKPVSDWDCRKVNKSSQAVLINKDVENAGPNGETIPSGGVYILENQQSKNTIEEFVTHLV